MSSKPGWMVPSDRSKSKQMLQDRVEQHKKSMESSIFSEHYKTSQATKLSRNDPNYGRPPPGSKSEKRALKAAALINSEIAFLCDIIYQEGEKFDDGKAVIKFGTLFQMYTVISSKLVGTLLRARKYSFVDFEGETLFQRRDDDVPVFLMKSIKEIKEALASDHKFQVGVSHATTVVEEKT